MWLKAKQRLLPMAKQPTASRAVDGGSVRLGDKTLSRRGRVRNLSPMA